MSGSYSAALGRLKVLILKPSSLGDVIHALPALRVLKRQYPHAEVHWWVEEGFAALLEGDPDLSKIYIFHRRNWRTFAGALGELSLAWELRNEEYDWVIDLQGLARSAWFGWLVRGKMTIGLDSGREGARAFYDVSVCRNAPETHAVDWCLDVVRVMGVANDMDYEWMPKSTCSHSPLLDSQSKWIAFCPGARWPNKCWPPDHFSRLATNLCLRDNHLRIAILGTSEDAGLGRIISGAAPNACLDLTGKTSLAEMIECMRSTRVVVANDSGPLHVAVALNRPLVALYGPTHAGHTGPYRKPDTVMRATLACAPCQVSNCGNQIERECLRAIPPDVVADAVRKIL
jgi:lipopolysaccharide heptosyltransferase I